MLSRLVRSLVPLTLVFSCSRPDASAPSALPPAASVCVVADMGSADPVLTQLATSLLSADAARSDAWALTSLISGLITSKETIDVWQSASAAQVTESQVQFGQTTGKSGAPSPAGLAAFTAEMAQADHLCDVSVTAIGGVTHHYVHVERQADGSLKTLGAFLARNPELSTADQAQADVVAAFHAVLGSLAD